MIPKIIHYCWFGDNEIPEKDRKCIDSWKKYCPDYEIKLWNESNYDISKCPYMEQAYKERKWGFVPDYARLDIIYLYGGIYLDTDVELIKPLDSLLENRCYCGFEDKNYVAFGLGFGAEAGHPAIKELRDAYQDKQFILEDGSLNIVASPAYQTEYLVSKGLQQNGERQSVEDIEIYPADFFAPKSVLSGETCITDNTVSIHHYAMSWFNEEQLKEIGMIRALIKKGFHPRVALSLALVVKVWGIFKNRDFKRIYKALKKRVVR